jgi:hypothetical protein
MKERFMVLFSGFSRPPRGGSRDMVRPPPSPSGFRAGSVVFYGSSLQENGRGDWRGSPGQGETKMSTGDRENLHERWLTSTKKQKECADRESYLDVRFPYIKFIT